MKSFEHWETEEVELTFGLEQSMNLTLLKDWLSANNPISDKEKELIERLQKKLKINADY